jgi:hypothetical protein
MTKKPHSKRDTAVPASPPATKGKARSALAEPAAAPPANTEGLDGAMRALALALDKKALEPVLLDVRELCSFCNYQLVVSGRSDRQVDAIADGISSGLKSEGERAIGAEGARSGQERAIPEREHVQIPRRSRLSQRRHQVEQAALTAPELGRRVHEQDPQGGHDHATPPRCCQGMARPHAPDSSHPHRHTRVDVPGCAS